MREFQAGHPDCRF